MSDAARTTPSGDVPLRAGRTAVLCALLLLGGVAPGPTWAAPVSKNKPPLTLVYDRTPAVCHALLNLYNHDISELGYVDTKAHAVFTAIHWAPLAYHPHLSPRAQRIASGEVIQIAFVDINNDGRIEPVVRDLVYMGPRAMGANSLTVLKATPSGVQQWTAWLRNPGKYVLAESPSSAPLGPPPRPMDILFYNLKHVPAKPISTEARPFGWPAFPTAALALHPLSYRGTVYVSVSLNAEPGKIQVGGDYGHWIVIGKYRPDNAFKDVCYFRVTRPWAQRR